ncbi:MAG: IS5 family transposase [Tepidimonas sp.]|nr:IS5 family transposase [Tepidimonas sp.]
MTDQYWQRVEPLIPQRQRVPGKQYRRRPGAGRPAKPARLVFEAIVHVLRTGCQWKALPRERYGCASAIHKRFPQWEAAGFFEALWRAGLAEYDGMQGIAWRWQSVDAAMMKVPLARQAAGPNPADPGKKGSKRHLLVDGRGVPLSLIVSAANVHDSTRLEELLTAAVFKRPRPPQRRNCHLFADVGYRSAKNLQLIDAHGYMAHGVGRRQEAQAKRHNPTYRPRRWLVEVCHGWFNRLRKLLVRYEKLERSFLALHHLAAAIIAFRKAPLEINIIYG